jgi:5-methylcytosine-specific restriction endonuclease McrA
MREILGQDVEDKDRKDSFGNEQFVFRKLKEMSDTDPTVVYNIEVEGTHSYIADGMVVHNCGFCGKKFHTEDLTIDHIIPKSKGGKMVWENVTLACIPCNGKKGDRSLAEAGMRLVRKPVRPSPEDLRRNPVERILYKVGHRPPKTWEQFLGKMFWETELKDS